MPQRARSSRRPRDRHVERATVRIPRHPAAREHELQYRGTESAGEVGTALTPVHTGKRESAPLAPCGLDVESEPIELESARRSDVVVDGPGWHSSQPSRGHEPVMEPNAERSGDVVITGPREPKFGRRSRTQSRGRSAGGDAQRFERSRDVGALEPVIPVPALRKHPDQPRDSQLLQVHARRRRRHVGDDGELGARAGAAVDEAIEHPRPGRLANRRREGRRRAIGVDIHACVVAELCASASCHTRLRTPLGRTRHDCDLHHPLSDRSVST